MAFRSEKLERTSGSGHRRVFSKIGVVKGSGCPANPHPPQSSAATNLSCFKKDCNGQDQQRRANPMRLNSEANEGVVVQAGSQFLAISNWRPDGLASKPLDQRNSVAITKSQSSQTSTRDRQTNVQKLHFFGVEEEASTPCHLLFGSITPGIMNGLQAHHETFRAVPILPVPTSQKQQHQQQETKKYTHVVVPSSSYPVALESSALPIDATQRPTPSQQVQVSVPFGDLSPLVQSHDIATSIVNTTPTLPVENTHRKTHPLTQLKGDVRVLVSSPPTAVLPKYYALPVSSMPGPAPLQQFGEYSKGIASLDAFEVQSVEISSGSHGVVVERETSQTEMDDNSQQKVTVTELPDGDTAPVMLLEHKFKSSMQIQRETNNVHKSMEQRRVIVRTSESADNSFTVDYEQVPIDVPYKNIIANDNGDIKVDLDECKVSADISTPELKISEFSENEHPTHGEKKYDDEFQREIPKMRKYSFNFLLNFAIKYTKLPKRFEIGSDIAEAFMSVPGDASRESHPNTGKITDMPSCPLRGGHRISGTIDNSKWKKLPGILGPGVDLGHGPAATNFRPNNEALRSLHRHPSQFTCGILNGPILKNADTNRWPHATSFQKGLIPPPQTPSQVMHKAEKKYQVGKVADKEEAKQRQLKAILNKLTPQNFEKLFEQVIAVNIDTVVTLTGVINQIFNKALMEPTFCEMYADFCFHLAGTLPDFTDNNENINFKNLLLNKCQEEFEKGENDQDETYKVDEGEIKESEEQRGERRIPARRRMLGNIHFIGELYKKKMITERVIDECIQKLFGPLQDPDEEDIEALCKLMVTIGEIIDHAKAKAQMDEYFDIMLKLSTSQKLSTRVRFMLKDVIDLRLNKWQPRRKAEGPKKIEQVHRDAIRERQAQTSRLVREPVTDFKIRQGPPPIEHVHRGSEPPSSSRNTGSIQCMPTQDCGQPLAHGKAQYVRLVDNQFGSRTISIPQTQRPITLGLQGSLAMGASTREQPLISNVPSGIHSKNSSPVIITSDCNGNSSKPCLTATSVLPFSSTPSIPEEKSLSEGALKEKSISAIKEFYSAKDEKEIALCVKELNTPSFYPSIACQWVMDSFERNDLERELLSKLLVNLCKPDDRLFTHFHLLKGLEYVLSLLEDVLNDAPRAGEFLGRIFATLILSNVVSLREIEDLIHQGGEELGSLLEVGLASEILGSILESIRSKKGATILNEIRLSSEIRLGHFKLSKLLKSKLDAYL